MSLDDVLGKISKTVLASIVLGTASLISPKIANAQIDPNMKIMYAITNAMSEDLIIIQAYQTVSPEEKNITLLSNYSSKTKESNVKNEGEINGLKFKHYWNGSLWLVEFDNSKRIVVSGNKFVYAEIEYPIKSYSSVERTGVNKFGLPIFEVKIGDKVYISQMTEMQKHLEGYTVSK